MRFHSIDDTIVPAISFKTGTNPSFARKTRISSNWSATFISTHFAPALVPAFDDLDTFLHCGHAAILGACERDWQDTEEVLKYFGSSLRGARHAYREFVRKGADQGRRNDLTGGGLIRSVGGWTNVNALLSAGLSQKSDERILGDGEFVESALSEAGERMDRTRRLKAQGFGLQEVAACVCRVLSVDESRLFAPGKERSRVAARSLLCYWAVRELGMSQTALSHMLKISPSAVTLSIRRGEELAEMNEYSLRLPEM
jgi:putative transposase